MIYVGLTKGIINATAHWYLAVTEDGTTFKNEDKDTLKEVGYLKGQHLQILSLQGTQ